MMRDIVFEWDEKKNRINKAKHNVSFEEARSVFYDFNAVLFDDPDHSETEDRFLILGMSEVSNILIVSHCYRENDSIRIISARKADRREEEVYYEGTLRY